jgi:hypothetical protein
LIPVLCQDLVWVPSSLTFDGIFICGHLNTTRHQIVRTWIVDRRLKLEHVHILDSSGWSKVPLETFLDFRFVTRHVLVLCPPPSTFLTEVVGALWGENVPVHVHTVESSLASHDWIESTNERGDALSSMSFDLVLDDNCPMGHWTQATLEQILTLLSPLGVLVLRGRHVVVTVDGSDSVILEKGPSSNQDEVGHMLSMLPRPAWAAVGDMLILGGSNVPVRPPPRYATHDEWAPPTAYIVDGCRTWVWNMNLGSRESFLVDPGDTSTGVSGIDGDFNSVEAWQDLRQMFDVIVFDWSTAKSFNPEYDQHLIDAVMSRVKPEGFFYLPVSYGRAFIAHQEIERLSRHLSARGAIGPHYSVLRVVGMPFTRPDKNYGVIEHYFKISHRITGPSRSGGTGTA